MAGLARQSYFLNPLELGKRQAEGDMFDQLGCGRSGRITDDWSLMSVDACMEQMRDIVEPVRRDRIFIYGHSWGSMLATDYYFKISGE